MRCNDLLITIFQAQRHNSHDHKRYKTISVPRLGRTIIHTNILDSQELQKAKLQTHTHKLQLTIWKKTYIQPNTSYYQTPRASTDDIAKTYTQQCPNTLTWPHQNLTMKVPRISKKLEDVSRKEGKKMRKALKRRTNLPVVQRKFDCPIELGIEGLIACPIKVDKESVRYWFDDTQCYWVADSGPPYYYKWKWNEITEEWVNGRMWSRFWLCPQSWAELFDWYLT